jgi:DNA-binding transcriptional LysR family regulator
MSRLTEIENFVEIIDAGSLSAVSRRSGLALSAVSRRLKDLELRLGVTLVRRSTRKISLTDAGHDFYLQCRQIITDLNDAESNLSEITHRLEGRIRLAAPVTFTYRHLSPILTEFMRLYPDVELELEANDRRIDLIQDGFDVAIRLGRLQDSSLRAKRLTRIRHLPVASKALLLDLGTPKKPEDISGFPVLQYRSTSQKNRWNFARPDGAVEGLGIAMEPTFICNTRIVAGDLVPLFPDYVWSDDAAYVVYPEARVLPQRVRTLIDHIASRFSADPSWDQEISKHYPLYQDGWA